MQRQTSRMLLLLSVLLISSCASLKDRIPLDSPYVSCKFELIVPTVDGPEKINGVVRLIKDERVDISFRAPMVRSELAFLEYTPSQLLAVDRTNKLFATSGYPIINTKGVEAISFEVFQRKILDAAFSSKRRVYMFASEFGWKLFGDATIELYQFNATPFDSKKVHLSKKYVETSIDTMLHELGL